jgi:O-antigen ligase
MSNALTKTYDAARFAPLADWLAVAVAVSLPWSTSATGILLVLWLLTLIPTLDWRGLRREIATAAGGLPILLLALGLAGMAWADVTLAERGKGLEPFLKLLVIPLLLVQFRRSDRGFWVLGGYVASCAVLLVASTLVEFVPGFSFVPMKFDHVLVKNEATQSGEFATCIFGLLFLAYESIVRRQWLWAVVLSAVTFGMLANIVYVASGRTALVVIIVLFVLFIVKKPGMRGRLVLVAAAIALVAVAALSSSFLRHRVVQIWTDYDSYAVTNKRNSSGERIEFAKKSIEFIRAAPVVGHGTGSIHSLFIKSSIGKTGAAASATTNPHNQTFAVAIQLGLVGAAVLWAMWIAHLLLFRGGDLAEWIGLVVVVQNIVGSVFNSHLFDFAQGWIYVVGVGVAGGIALKNRATAGAAGAP